MQDYTTAENGKSDCTEGSGQHQVTTSGRTEAKSSSRGLAWNRLDLSRLVERARLLTVTGLTIFPETIRRTGPGYFGVLTECQSCNKREEKDLRNMEKGMSSKCRCQRGGERAAYGIPTAISKSLGSRYNAMIQRCYKDTHVSICHYLGRGIEVEFQSRREFILWALEKWPNETFKRKDFDREDNNGNYSKGNLRLVSRSVNLLNRRRSGSPDSRMGREFLARHPEVTYTVNTCLGLMRQGMSEAEILARHRRSKKAGWRKPTTS